MQCAIQCPMKSDVGNAYDSIKNIIHLDWMPPRF